MWQGNAYLLNGFANGDPQTVRFRDKKLYLHHHSDLESVIGLYGDLLLTEIESYLKKNIAQYQTTLNALEQRQKTLNTIERQNSRTIVDKVNNTRLEITNKGTSKNRTKYTVSLHIDPYIMERKGKEFYFEGVTVASVVEVKNDTIRLLGKPAITTPKPYRHPFVWRDDNNICYNSNIDRFAQEGVQFTEFSLKDPEKRFDAANCIATAMNIPRKVFHRGYASTKVIPVHDLNIKRFEQEFEKAKTAPRAGIVVYDNNPIEGK